MKHFRIIALLLCALLAMGACAAEPASTGSSGSFTVGGDLCVYDTETDTYRRLTDTAKDGFQICSFEIEGRDYLVFDCVQYDEAMMPWHSQAMLAMAELYDVIRSGGTVDLRS